MVRIIAIFTGLIFIFVLVLGAVTGLIDAAGAEESASDKIKHECHKHAKDVNWYWEGNLGLGVLGGFDRPQLQRGMQVYREVCSSCHGLEQVAFRNFTELGFTPEEVKVIANEWPIPVASINPDTGEADTRPAEPADRVPSPYPNDVAARAANNNAMPPDMSLLAKSRPGGADYLYSLITGYEELPADFPEEAVQEGLNYNPYFHSLWIAMPPLLSDGIIQYAEGQPEATVDQMGQDVAAFLTWAAEPKMEERKQAGIGVIVFLLIATSLAYLSYRRVWADVKGH
ncbi:MAG: cytochrome c1 [Pseudomonadota bacterium]